MRELRFELDEFMIYDISITLLGCRQALHRSLHGVCLASHRQAHKGSATIG